MTGRIAIVGAGPAGLTAAIAARRLGLEVIVYEQAEALGRVGGGIVIHDNGQRVLDALGLLSGFASRMATARTIVINGPEGALARLDYGVLRMAFPRFAVVLRADLQAYLLEGAERAGVRLELGRRCTGIVRERDGTGLRFADGASAECTAVLGADGLNSAVRSSGGFAGTHRAVGEAALRGVAERRAIGDLVREFWLPDGRLFGIAPLTGNRTYFYCSAPLGRWHELVNDVRSWIDGWRAVLPEAADVLTAVGDWTRVSYDEFREVTVRRWWSSSCFLLGDAAHAMTPNLGQGANSAMVDALVLVRLLRDTNGTLDDVGRRYDAVRRPFVRRVQVASRIMCGVASWTSPPARLVRRAILTVGNVTERITPVGLRLAAGAHAAEDRYLEPLDH